VALEALHNCDPQLNNPKGVKVEGIIYGGRDSDIWPPVFESFDWIHGVITLGASLESEVTFATLDKEGERKFNPFSNLDFLSIPIGQYIMMHLELRKKLSFPPKIFAVNYFLKDKKDGSFLNAKEDKHVWLKWMELRVHNDVEAVKTPIGFLPCYDDLKILFKEVLCKDYKETSYIQQFTLRVNNNLAKIERIERIYKNIDNIPSIVFEVLKEQKERLEDARAQFGDFISPHCFV
jgi:phosphoenolpyruvate carboxykinase (GTP)